ncbi:MAG: AMP-binding protein [Solirubrobacteraceae bacterium]
MSGPVVRYGEREIPHDELRLEAARTAAGLAAAGVRHSDRVALVLRNEPTFLSLSAACGLMGAVPVPVNWHWHGKELRHVITHSDSRVVFAHSDFIANVEEVLPDGVPLVEVPVPDELTAHYGAAPITGRRPLFADWIGAHEPTPSLWMPRR